MTELPPAGDDLPAARRHVKDAITPLRLIFWGGLLCVVDFTFTFSGTGSGQGFKFDILNDALGMVLITIGVFKLGAVPVHRRYHNAMIFVKVMAVIGLAQAVLGHFIFPMPLPLAVLSGMLSLATLPAIVTFCVAMRWFCQEAVLPDAGKS